MLYQSQNNYRPRQRDWRMNNLAHPRELKSGRYQPYSYTQGRRGVHGRIDERVRGYVDEREQGMCPQTATSYSDNSRNSYPTSRLFSGHHPIRHSHPSSSCYKTHNLTTNWPSVSLRRGKQSTTHSRTPSDSNGEKENKHPSLFDRIFSTGNSGDINRLETVNSNLFLPYGSADDEFDIASSCASPSPPASPNLQGDATSEATVPVPKSPTAEPIVELKRDFEDGEIDEFPPFRVADTHETQIIVMQTIKSDELLLTDEEVYSLRVFGLVKPPIRDLYPEEFFGDYDFEIWNAESLPAWAWEDD